MLKSINRTNGERLLLAYLAALVLVFPAYHLFGAYRIIPGFLLFPGAYSILLSTWSIAILWVQLARRPRWLPQLLFVAISAVGALSNGFEYLRLEAALFMLVVNYVLFILQSVVVWLVLRIAKSRGFRLLHLSDVELQLPHRSVHVANQYSVRALFALVTLAVAMMLSWPWLVFLETVEFSDESLLAVFAPIMAAPLTVAMFAMAFARGPVSLRGLLIVLASAPQNLWIAAIWSEGSFMFSRDDVWLQIVGTTVGQSSIVLVWLALARRLGFCLVRFDPAGDP